MTAVAFVAFLASLFSVTTVPEVRVSAAWLRWIAPFSLGAWAVIVTARTLTLPRAPQMADVLACAFIFLALSSSFYSINPGTTVLRALSVLLYYGAVFWGMWLLADACAAEGLARLMLRAAMLATGLHFLTLLLSPTWAFYHGTGRFVGWAENPGAVGSMAALSMPLALWRARSTGR